MPTIRRKIRRPTHDAAVPTMASQAPSTSRSATIEWQGYRLVYESCQYARQALRVIIAHEACPTPLFLSKTPPKAPDA